MQRYYFFHTFMRKTKHIPKMKQLKVLALLFVSLFVANGCCNKDQKCCKETAACCEQTACENEKKLRHVVFFGFENTVTIEDVTEIEKKFASLPCAIPEIKGFEWGIDCSPEGLQRGHTHCFFLTFSSEADRDIYIEHPAHKELGALLNGKLKNVTVIDYWVK